MTTRATTAAVVLMSLLLVGGCHSPINGLYPPTSDGTSVDMYIVNNHWHTGFVLERSQLSPRLQKLLSRFGQSRYVEIGWGDADFYPAPVNTVPLAMRAMFASRGTVFHIVGIDREPQEHFPDYLVELYRLRISAAGHKRLLEFLERSFATTDTGESIELQPGLYGKSYFYKVRGHYWFLHNCNHWAADGIRATGFPISPGYAATANNIGWQIRTFGKKYQHDIVVQRQ